MESIFILKLSPRRCTDFSMRSHASDWDLATLWYNISHSSTRPWPDNAGSGWTASQQQAPLTFPIHISNSTNWFFPSLSKLPHHQSLCITTNEVETKIRKWKINRHLFFFSSASFWISLHTGSSDQEAYVARVFDSHRHINNSTFKIVFNIPSDAYAFDLIVLPFLHKLFLQSWLGYKFASSTQLYNKNANKHRNTYTRRSICLLYICWSNW